MFGLMLAIITAGTVLGGLVMFAQYRAKKRVDDMMKL